MSESGRLPGLFVTGTDTGVGKTYVTAMIAVALSNRGVRAGAYKPVCTGATPKKAGGVQWEDVERLCAATGGQFDRRRICPQCFEAALAPPVAAEREKQSVDGQLLRDGAFWWTGRVDVLLVEGVGGLLCPLTATETVADLAKDLQLPLLIVARNGLGTINHTLLTIEVARHRGLAVAAVILNDGPQRTGDESTETNAREISARIDVPLMRLRQDASQCEPLGTNGSEAFDWLQLIRRAMVR
ncbi:MAG: dethiobiotin synthase [Planctomycetes bacterium]|nr:dethiobiotin synthase [Planctomycetota bacterium]